MLFTCNNFGTDVFRYITIYTIITLQNSGRNEYSLLVGYAYHWIALIKQIWLQGPIAWMFFITNIPDTANGIQYPLILK